MPDSQEILHIITKPVVDGPFLQDWLAFLSQEQRFRVHLFYTQQAFEDCSAESMVSQFPYIQLHRIENISPNPALTQGIVFFADYLDLRYLSRTIRPSLIHSHDTRSLLIARYFFPTYPRLHSWWLEDRTAHRLWRVTIERLAQWRTWECLEGEEEDSGTSFGPLLGHTQFPLPSPLALDGNYKRSKPFATLREVYRSILRTTDLPLRQ